MLLAMILKALGPHTERYYESDDDNIPDRVPLLQHYAPSPSYVVADPRHSSKSDSWNIRINSKVGLGDFFWCFLEVSIIFVGGWNLMYHLTNMVRHGFPYLIVLISCISSTSVVFGLISRLIATFVLFVLMF